MQEKAADPDGGKINELIQLADDITKEQVITLLKEKQKEFSMQSAKLGKLEKKYLSTFKENKGLKKDCDAFIRVLKSIFNEENCMFVEKQMGEYDPNELLELWDRKQKSQDATILKLNSEFNQEKMSLSEKLQAQLSQQTKEMQLVTQKQLSAQLSQNSELQQNNAKLSREIVELNELLNKKNLDIAELKIVSQQYQALKAENLIKELQNNKLKASQSNNINTRIKESEMTNQILQLRNEKEMILDQLSVLRKENEDFKKKLTSIQNSLTPSTHQRPAKHEADVQTHSPATQRLSSTLQQPAEVQNEPSEVQEHPDNQDSARQTGDPLKAQNAEGEKASLSSELKMAEEYQINKQNYINTLIAQQNCMLSENSPKNIEVINQQYLKNVIVKYFVYNESGNYKEANLLMNVILTILKLSAEERKSVEDARSQYSIWGQTKNFITDKFFTKSPGVVHGNLGQEANQHSLMKQSSLPLNSSQNLNQKP